jgi:cell division FtsZ-interacting protein ZapD
VTVSDGERLKRGSLTDEERAKWAVKAWRLNDKFGMSFRAIEDKWAAEGFLVSHVTIRKWVNDARTQSKILELYEPAQVRLELLGQLERYRDAIQAAMDNTEIEFDVGMKMLLGVADRISKLTNAPVTPTNRTEIVDVEKAMPNAALMEELRKVTEHDNQTEEREANDGLMD